MTEVLYDRQESQRSEFSSKFFKDVGYLNGPDGLKVDHLEQKPEISDVPRSNLNLYGNALPGNDSSAGALPSLTIVESAEGEPHLLSHNPERMELSTDIINDIINGGTAEGYKEQIISASRVDRNTLAKDLVEAAVEYRSLIGARQAVTGDIVSEGVEKQLAWLLLTPSRNWCEVKQGISLLVKSGKVRLYLGDGLTNCD